MWIGEEIAHAKPRQECGAGPDAGRGKVAKDAKPRQECGAGPDAGPDSDRGRCGVGKGQSDTLIWAGGR